jgi:alkylated DNA repair dioxygenase AlkB
MNLLDTEGDWSSELKRRVIHYGYKYDYKSRNAMERAKAIPGECEDVARRLLDAYDQLIVNEYQPGQGISAHVDSLAFEDGIASISLGSGVVMRFSQGASSVDVWLPRRSVVLLTGDARFKWRHSIPSCCKKTTKDTDRERVEFR